MNRKCRGREKKDPMQCRLPGVEKSTDLSENPIYALNKYKIW